MNIQLKDVDNVVFNGTDIDKVKFNDVLVWKKGKIYGFQIDQTGSDSAAAVTYTDDAVGMTPAAMNTSTGVFSYGDWADNDVIKYRPCVVNYDGSVEYYLDPDDFTKKADGTAATIDSSCVGNVMIEFDKMYYKFIPETNGFKVSNIRWDSSWKCWSFINCDGDEIPHFYISAYNGTGSDKLRSISGVTTDANSGCGGLSGTTEITRATANNTTAKTEWYTRVIADRLLINALLILFGKSLDSQTVFGPGLTAGGQTAKEAYVTGSLNNKGMFWGGTTSQAVKVFGIENWWGHSFDRTAGSMQTDGAYKIKLTWGQEDGSAVTGYQTTDSSKHISVSGALPTTNGYVTEMYCTEYGFHPKATQSGSSALWKDYYYYNTGTRYALIGGYASGGVDAGAWYFSLSNAVSAARWSFAASLSLKPLRPQA